MGDEKLDNAVYTIRGLYDLADMARAEEGPARRTRGRATRRATSSARSRPPGGTCRPSSTPTRSSTPTTAVVPEALDRPDADGGRAHPRTSARGRAWRPSPTARRARRPRGPVLLGRAPLQPRALPHRLRRRARGQGRADDLRAEHLDPVRRRGQLRPAWAPSTRSATPTRSPSRCSPSHTAAGTWCTTPRRRRTSSPARRRDLPVAGLRPGRAARRERRALYPLPLDGHAGVEPLRDDLARRPPAARRAARRSAAGAWRSCRTCPRRTSRSSPARTSAWARARSRR